MSMQKHRVWISAAGTGNGFASVMALKKNFPESYILTTDINPAHLTTSSLFSNLHLVSPRADEECYPQFIIDTIKQYNIDTFVPVIDSETGIAAKLFSENKLEPGLSLQLKDPLIADICENKLLSHLFLLEHDLPSPDTSSLIQPFDSDEYVLKPIRGFGSQIRILSKKDLTSIDDMENYIVQALCHAPEVTIDVLHSKPFNYFYYLCRERIQTKGGVCTKARLFQDDGLGNIAYSLAQLLGLNAFCFQVMRLRESWVVTDINPRLGAGSSISTVAGSDFFSGMFAALWHMDPSNFIKKITKECYVTRQFSEYLM